MSKSPFEKVHTLRPDNASAEVGVTSAGKTTVTPSQPTIADSTSIPTPGELVRFPGSGAAATSAGVVDGSYLSTVDPDSVRFAITMFDGNKNAIPKQELRDLCWEQFVEQIAPATPPVVLDKARAPYFGSYTLRTAPLVGKTREHAERNRRPLEGKQRSNAHVDKCGPAIVVDSDIGNIFDHEARARALFCRYAIYPSFSFGVKRPDGRVKLGGRIVLAGDRMWTPDEHPQVMAAVNHVIGGIADTQAMAVSQIMGSAVRRSPDAFYERRVSDGGVLSIDKLVALGELLAPVGTSQRERSNDGTRKSIRRYEAYQVDLALKLIPNDGETDYTKWLLTGAGIYSALDEDGLPLFLEWSAQNPKHDEEFATRKYLKDASGLDFGAEGLMWTARHRAEDITHTLYPAPLAPAFEQLRGAALRSASANMLYANSLAGGLEQYHVSETLDRAQIIKQFGTDEQAIVASVAFMRSTWTDTSYRKFLSNCSIPEPIVQKGEAHAAALRESAITGQRAIIEQGGGIGGGIGQVRDAILGKVLAGELALFQQGQTVLCRLVRGPDGQVKVTPVNSPATLRTLIAEWAVLKVRLKDGAYGYEDIRFTGKGQSAEFDPGMLKDLYERVLPEALPELVAVSSVPIMPSLPATGSLEHLMKRGADEIASADGYHRPSKLFIASEGATPTRKARP